MDLNPYLTFNGQCEAAFKFYEQVLGGRIVTMVPHEGTPAGSHVPADWGKKILHARLSVRDKVLMGSDVSSDRYESSKGMSVSISVDTPEEAERIFHALSEKGTVQMPIQKTFFSARFGMFLDQFGIPWMVICEPAA